MLLSAKKSECSFFSTKTNESKWQPNLILDGQTVRHKATPKFCGATHDRHLIMLLLLATAESDRQEPCKTDPLRVGDMTVKTSMQPTSQQVVQRWNMAHVLWLLWISNTTLENQERSQRYAAQAITGQLCTTTVNAILAKANLTTIKTRSIQLSMTAMEKALLTERGSHIVPLSLRSLRQ